LFNCDGEAAMSEQKEHDATIVSDAGSPSDSAGVSETFRIPDAARRFRRVPFVLSVELGSGKLKIRDVLALRHHSVIELKRAAGSALDIRVNGLLLAKGEPVIYESRVGIQIHEIVDSEN
jgi:flagellar motor switch protein FliN